MYKSYLIVLMAAMALLSSCATASFSHYKGVGRIKQYDFYSEQLPDSFDGFRVAFASDFHYESRFTSKRLPELSAPCSRSMPMSCCSEGIIGDGTAGMSTNFSAHWSKSAPLTEHTP